MKKSLLLLIIFFLAGTILFAQPVRKADKEIYNPKNRIGISGSMISGWGLTYQRNFNPLAVKLVAFYYYYQNGDGSESLDQVNLIGGPFNYNDKQSLGSLGLELKYYIFQSRYVHLYPFIGASYWFDYEDEMATDYRYENGVYKTYAYTRKDNSDNYNFGAGFGLELIAGKYVAFNFDVGFKYLSSQVQRDNYQYPPVTKDLEELYIGIAVGGGITFAF